MINECFSIRWWEGGKFFKNQTCIVTRWRMMKSRFFQFISFCLFTYTACTHFRKGRDSSPTVGDRRWGEHYIRKTSGNGPSKIYLYIFALFAHKFITTVTVRRRESVGELVSFFATSLKRNSLKNINIIGNTHLHK